MNTNTDAIDNLDRRCWINAVIIRNDGLDCSFQAKSWREFCRLVVETADGIWARVEGNAPGKGSARVFGCEEGKELEEHTVAECRRIVAGVARAEG